MIIISEQEATYPRLRDRLVRLEGLARANPHIVASILDAVMLAGTAGEASARARQLMEAKLWRALSYGDAPEVMVMDAPGACSHHLPGTNSIVLEKSLVQRFEDAEPGSQGAAFLGQEILAIFLQSLVHWLCSHSFADAEASAGAVAELRKTAFQALRG